MMSCLLAKFFAFVSLHLIVGHGREVTKEGWPVAKCLTMVSRHYETFNIWVNTEMR